MPPGLGRRGALGKQRQVRTSYSKSLPRGPPPAPRGNTHSLLLCAENHQARRGIRRSHSSGIVPKVQPALFKLHFPPHPSKYVERRVLFCFFPPGAQGSRQLSYTCGLAHTSWHTPVAHGYFWRAGPLSRNAPRFSGRRNARARISARELRWAPVKLPTRGCSPAALTASAVNQGAVLPAPPGDSGPRSSPGV